MKYQAKLLWKKNLYSRDCYFYKNSYNAEKLFSEDKRVINLLEKFQLEVIAMDNLVYFFLVLACANLNQ